MKAHKFFFWVIALLIWAVSPILAQTEIITASEFADLSKTHKDLVIIDASKAKTFEAAHIKGAIHINHNDLYQKEGIEGVILSPEELAAFFGKKGISETSEIVIYDEGSQKYSTRLYWILKYLGAQHVNILHKDMDAWKAARIVLTPTLTEVKAVTFTPTVNPAFITDMEYIKANLENPDVILIDNRTPEEYAGTPDSKSEGHLPGAINLNHTDLLTESGAFKSKDELTAMAENLGITPDKELILYCKTSVRAAVAFVAFRNILGYENVRVYDGAYNEWVANNPVIQ